MNALRRDLKRLGNGETLPLPLPRGWSWCILNGTVCAPCGLQFLSFPADGTGGTVCTL